MQYPYQARQEYNFTSLEINYESNRAQLFAHKLDLKLGQFYYDSIKSLGAEFNYRIQP